MKNILYFLTALVFLTACEDKVNIKVPAGESQLAVDAKLFTYVNTSFLKPLKTYEPNYVKLSLTNGYDDGPTPIVDNAEVYIREGFSGIEEKLFYEGNGKYVTTSLRGNVDSLYFLRIEYNGNTYLSGDKINRVITVDSIEVNNVTTTENGRAPGFFLKLVAKDLQGPGDYYRIKTYKNSILFNSPNNITLAYDAGFGSGSPVDNLEFIFPIAVIAVNPRTGVTDEATRGDKSTFVAGDTARIEIWSISAPTILFYDAMRRELTNEGLFARPAVNLPCNIYNKNPAGPKAVGWFSVSAVSGKDVIIK